MKLAYLIMAHTDPKHLRRLLDALYVKGATDFYVHVDRKVDIAPFKAELSNVIENVKMVEKRIYTTWGGYSQVLAYQSLMRECIASGTEYGHVFLLSGLDYPLWSKAKILKYMEEHPTIEFVRAKCITGTIMGEFKCSRYHYFRDMRTPFYQLRRCLIFAARHLMGLLPLRKKQYVMTNGKRNDIYFASEWFCMTGRCMSYVYDQLTNNKDWERYFKHAYCPDELVVATILFNSPFAEHAFKWKVDDGDGLEGVTLLHYIEYTDAIQIYDEKDYNKLIISGKMFARKLVTGKSDKLMDKLDRMS